MAAMAARVEPHLDAESPLVRAMAVWALVRLGPPARLAELRAHHLPGEPDAAVRAEWKAATGGATSP
jgi:epoxyqueuosine reductase